MHLGGQSATVPVRVAGFAGYPKVHFANDMMPLFSKLGCNSGGCHGKASGQNGFKLSVFGFDPAADYDALVKEARGRRSSPPPGAEPAVAQADRQRSPHGGGRRLDAGFARLRPAPRMAQAGHAVGESGRPRSSACASARPSASWAATPSSRSWPPRFSPTAASAT